VPDHHYSLPQARRSLVRFAFGKLGSALTGVVLLVVMVRYVDRADYGLYVAVIAVLEIFYLVTGIGLSSFAQRYVPEFRMRASRRRLSRVINVLIVARIVFAIGFALLLLMAASSIFGVNHGVHALGNVWMIGGVFVAGCLVRYLDELFAALLMQGTTQVLLMTRSATKLAVIGTLLVTAVPVSIERLLWIELTACLISVVFGIWALTLHLRDHPDEGSEDAYASPRMWGMSLRFYLVQVLGQVYGLDLLKLLIAKMLGVGQTAAFGVAQALAEMIRNYLPAYLLAGWMRPLVVSRYLNRGDNSDLSLFVGLALKLNLFGIAPLVAFFAGTGREFAVVVSGGRYDDIGPILTWLSLLLAFQTAHLVLNIVTLAIERPGANLAATLLSCVGLPVAVSLLPLVGAVGAVWGLIIAEAIWCAYVWVSLRRAGVRIQPDFSGIVRLFFAGVVAFAVLHWLHDDGSAVYLCFRNFFVVAVVFLGLTALMKPLSTAERDLLARFVPRRWLVW
jgi:O-antigen/teichoic acid export membrane protein